MLIANFINSSEVTTDRLFQWDIGQQITLQNIGVATAPNVHFCNKKSENALVVAGTNEGDNYVYNIPNTLLAEEYDITAFIYVGNNDSAKTIKVVHIPVTKRTKPTNYIYTTDKDVIDFMAISAEIHALLDGLIITPYDNTKTYIKPNIVYYMGCTYICTSETDITGVLPTDTTKWGLMCKNGANISEITFSDDTLHFTLETGGTISVPLNSIALSTSEQNIEDIPGLNITKDENGVLKFNGNVIPQRQILWSGDETVDAPTGSDTLYQYKVLNLTGGTIAVGDWLEIKYCYRVSSLYNYTNTTKFKVLSINSPSTPNNSRIEVGLVTDNSNNMINGLIAINTTALDKISVSNSCFYKSDGSYVKYKAEYFEIAKLIE